MAGREFARVVNVGDRLWRDKHENREYRLEPGEEMIVPWAAMVRWLGDPDAKDGAGPRDRKRADWRARLNAKYGMADAPFYADAPRAVTHTEWEDAVPYVEDDGSGRFRHPHLPRLEVFDPISGERVFTVVDDPDGDRHRPVNVVSPSDTQAEMIAALERQIAQLRADMNARPAPRPSVPVEDLPPVAEDGPQRRRAKASVG